ncbi:DUF6159 family protein [Labrenzia sp. CE80]|uniref:DUF6159 family protein n=1 Tax=Labrenzia sp. CE80 TaxID=1788986 RepID=UPI00129B426A|nr:DUF6159 family protein [Labrenzia sp. CE80]
MAVKQQAELGLSVNAQSIGFFGSHKWLALFPIASFVFSLVFIALVAFGVFEIAFSTDLVVKAKAVIEPLIEGDAGSGQENDKMKLLSVAGFVVLFCLHVCISFVFKFFNVALAACVLEIFEGKSTGFLGGVSIATRRLGAVFSWSFISATVGSISSLVERRGFGIATILTMLAGLAWRMATFFVVPIIASKNTGSVSAIKESVHLMRSVWGASVVSRLGLSWLKLVLFGIVVAGLSLVHLISGPQALIDSLAVVTPIGLIAIVFFSCVGTISRAALFYYASKNLVPSQFNGETLRNAIVEKRGKH